MFRYNVNKKALTIAALIILLCLVSLTGATLALFTSSTDDGKIGINATSGSLKIDIIDDTENQDSLVGEVLSFVPKNGDDEILFEPGATYHTQGFRIKNDSSIPIKFIVYISNDEKVSPDFFDAFDVWLTEDPLLGRDGMVKIDKYDGFLAKDQISKVLYLVFSMKEDAGNKYQNRPFNGVGITVCAVQGNGYIEIEQESGS